MKLGYKCNIIISSDWEEDDSNEQKYLKFQKYFPWLFNIRKWHTDPSIHVSRSQIALLEGELVAGTVKFDYYSEEVVINGGQIEGMNVFKGKFRGGIYSEGSFEGTFIGGVFNLDRAVWTKMAKASPPGNLKTGFVYSVIYKGKLYKVSEEVLNFEINGKRIYQDIGEILKALSAGKWKEIEITAKQSALSSHTKTKKYRGDDELSLDPSESDVPDWVSDDSGGSAAKIITLENYIPASGSMLSVMYENYLTEKSHPLDEPVTMFGESFGYYLSSPIHSFISGFDESEIIYAMTKLLGFNEKVWKFDDLDDQEQDILYNVFRDTYIKTTGAAFDKDDFDWRAANWTFFGEPPSGTSNEASVGGIAVRKQISNNMYKLVASFGNFRGVLKGFDELKQKTNGAAIWGIVDETIRKLIIKHDKDFVAPPGIVVKAMEAGIKKLSNGEVKSVSLDGAMQVNTPAGMMKKYFVANKDYIKWLLDSVNDPANASRLPVPQAALAPLIGVIQKLL